MSEIQEDITSFFIEIEQEGGIDIEDIESPGILGVIFLDPTGIKDHMEMVITFSKKVEITLYFQDKQIAQISLDPQFALAFLADLTYNLIRNIKEGRM